MFFKKTFEETLENQFRLVTFEAEKLFLPESLISLCSNH